MKSYPTMGCNNKSIAASSVMETDHQKPYNDDDAGKLAVNKRFLISQCTPLAKKQYTSINNNYDGTKEQAIIEFQSKSGTHSNAGHFVNTVPANVLAAVMAPVESSEGEDAGTRIALFRSNSDEITCTSDENMAEKEKGGCIIDFPPEEESVVREKLENSDQQDEINKDEFGSKNITERKISCPARITQANETHREGNPRGNNKCGYTSLVIIMQRSESPPKSRQRVHNTDRKMSIDADAMISKSKDSRTAGVTERVLYSKVGDWVMVDLDNDKFEVDEARRTSFLRAKRKRELTRWHSCSVM